MTEGFHDRAKNQKKAMDYLKEAMENKTFMKILGNIGKNKMTIKQELEQTPYTEGETP